MNCTSGNKNKRDQSGDQEVDASSGLSGCPCNTYTYDVAASDGVYHFINAKFIIEYLVSEGFLLIVGSVLCCDYRYCVLVICIRISFASEALEFIHSPHSTVLHI